MDFDSSSILQALFFIILIAFFIYSGFARRGNLPSFWPKVIIWGILFSALIIVYAFRFELESFKDRLLAVLIPSYSWTNEQGELTIARHRDGHFYVNATTKNKQTIKFLIDTGASDIALTQKDARKLGFDTRKIRYTKTYNTANGKSMAAPVRIREITIGGKKFYNLQAHITSGKLDISLLGMSLIGEFDHFKINNDLLILSY